MYQSLSIKDFREIESLEITDLKRFNLLVGRNNCGKTTVLEAFFLLSGMSNPRLPVSIHRFRGLAVEGNRNFNYLFRALDSSAPVKLNGLCDGIARSLTIVPVYLPPTENAKMSLDEGMATSSAIERWVKGLTLEFQVDGGELFKSEVTIGGALSFPPNYKESVMCTFLSQQTLTVGLGRRIGLLVEQKRLEPLLPALRAFDPRITSVCIGADSQVLVDVGLDSLLPLELMGDGVVKALALLASVVEAKNGVVVVDEIDNGLHHAPLAELWKAVFVACEECNTQLVATTHSYECVEAFSQTYGEIEPDGDDIRLYRIDKDVGHHELVMYTAPLLRLGMEKAFEVR